MKTMIGTSGDAARLKDAVIGYQWLYSIRRDDGSKEIAIPAQTLRDLLAKHGLDQYMPKASRGHDDFRRWTRELEGKDPFAAKNTEAFLHVREVYCDQDEIERVLGREVVVPSRRTVEYTIVARMTYYRRSGTVHIAGQSPYRELVERSLRDARWGVVNEARIREAIYRMVSDLHPTSLKPGVWFVLAAYREEILAVDALVKELSQLASGGTIYTNMVSILEPDRIKIEDRFRIETQRQIAALHEEVNEVDVSNPRSIAKVMELMKKVSEKIAVYEELLAVEAALLKEQLRRAEERLTQRLLT